MLIYSLAIIPLLQRREKVRPIAARIEALFPLTNRFTRSIPITSRSCSICDDR